MKVHIHADLGHSQSKVFLKEFNMAFANGDIKFLLNSITDDISWTIIGDKKIDGKAEFEAALKEISNGKVAELTLDKIITHGRDAAACGLIVMENGRRYAFSDFYEFRNTNGDQVKSIISHMTNVT
ncbi:MAG: nuclear transport factor 2 family protein [Calditrichota bacterium]